MPPPPCNSIILCISSSLYFLCYSFIISILFIFDKYLDFMRLFSAANYFLHRNYHSVRRNDALNLLYKFYLKPPAGLTQTAVAFVEKRRKPRPELRSLSICYCFTLSKQTRFAQTMLAFNVVKQNNACSLRKGRLFK